MRQAVAHSRRHAHFERLPAPAHIRAVTARMNGVTFDMLGPDRCVVAKELYWGHGQRPKSADQMALDVFAALAKDAALVLDIGSYTGIFSLLAGRATSDSQIHAFEIVPEVAKAAIDNVVANDLLTRITVHLAGLGRDAGQVRIARGEGGSALPDFYSTKLRFNDGVQVPLYSLDAFDSTISVPAEEARRTLVKIDVEGTEDEVLRHGQQFLAHRRPDILCEILYDAADTNAVTAALAPCGYRYLLVQDDALVPQTQLHANKKYRDWLFTTLTDEELRQRGITVTSG